MLYFTCQLAIGANENSEEGKTMTETGRKVTVAGVELIEHQDEFSFKVPDDSPVEKERGQTVKQNFTYPQVTTEAEATAVCKEKEWDLVEFVNAELRDNARANAYQSLSAAHRPSKVSAEDIRERMIRDYIRLGIPADVARKQVEGLLAQQTAG